MSGAAAPGVRLRVYGRVQGVGFRYWVWRRGREAGLKGWVRNLPDGSVEMALSGEPRRLESFRELLELGPPAARVERVEETELTEPLAGDGIEVVY